MPQALPRYQRKPRVIGRPSGLAQDAIGNGWTLLGYKRLGTAAASITFPFPTGFKELWLICQIIKATSGTVGLTINADGGTDYDKQYLLGNSTGVTGARATGQTSIVLAGSQAIPDAGAGLYSIRVTKELAGAKALVSAGCAVFADLATDALVVSGDAGIWSNTADLMTSVTLTASAGNLAANSVFWLLGSL